MNEDWNAVRFLAQLRADQERGEPRSLAEYLAMFAGDEALIAQEYLAAMQSASDPEHEITNLGPYELGHEIGRGAQGVVFAARHRRLKRDVAIKLIPSSAANSDSAALRLLREAVAVSRLDHPGLCKIYDVGRWQGQPYFAMQLAERGTLADHLREMRKRHSLVPVARAIDIVRAVADAVHTAHQAGVTHRDLKPANIALSASDRPVVLDFGLALDRESPFPAVAEAPSCGTLEYMAPEQFGDREVDCRADVWALGVILCELLVGFRPFTGSTRATVLASMLANQLPIEIGRRRGVSRDLRAVLSTALASDPAKRYQTAADLRDDLDRVTRNIPALASRSGSGTAAWRWAQRNRTLAAAIAVTVIASATALITTDAMWTQQSEASAVAASQATAAHDCIDKLMLQVDEGLRNLPESTVARRQLLITIRSWLVELAKQDAGNVETVERLSATYVKLGDVLGHPGTRNLGQIDEALKSYACAINVARQHPESSRLLRAQAVAFNRRGATLLSNGTVSAAEQDLTHALNLLERAAPEGSQLELLREQATAIGNLARSLEYRNDWARALPLWDRAIARGQAALKEDDSDDKDRARLEFVRTSRALALTHLGRSHEALPELRSAAEKLESIAEHSPGGGADLWPALSQAWRGVSRAATLCRDSQSSFAAINRCVHWRRAAFERDSKNVSAAVSYASGLRQRHAHIMDRDNPEHQTDLDLAEELLANVLEQHPEHWGANRAWVQLQREFGRLLRSRGQLQLANERLSRALETARTLANLDPENLRAAQLMSSCESELEAEAVQREH